MKPFKRKMFNEMKYTEKGYTSQGSQYGYTFTKDFEDIEITLNIIPYKNEWICQKVTFNRKDYKNGLKFNECEKTERFAYMTTKERAFEEMFYQYDYLLKEE